MMAEQRHNHHLQVVFTRKMEERRVFMEELKEIRAETYRRVFKKIKKMVGPKWYQVLSTNQHRALDTLDTCVYQDLLEGRPVRTMKVLRILGIYPRPRRLDLLHCMFLGRNDPKEVLAQIFLYMYGHHYSAKLPTYDLNGRTLLSSIYYLGLESLIHLLEEKFKPEPPTPCPPKKPKPKPRPVLKSPYLQELPATLYEPKRNKPKRPLPLPNLEHLNDPYEDTPPVPKPPPPPPPPPPPKKRLPQYYCDKLGEFTKIEPYVDKPLPVPVSKRPAVPKKFRSSKLCITESKKKVYGLDSTFRKPKKKNKKPHAPSTGFSNAQYLIIGVHVYNEKAYFILGSVSITPADGEIIHGGHRLLNGEYVRIHNGYRGNPPDDKSQPCDCLKEWHDSIFNYLSSTKCYCGHRYDFGHEVGTFPPEEPSFFDKPNRRTGFQFNYTNIYETDQRMVQVAREIKRQWDTESMLHEDDPDDPDGEKKKKRKKVVKKSSKTCLGTNPTVEDYLRCALRYLRRINAAARLPELHLAPELKEWMRYRIYGRYSRHFKREMIKKTVAYYAYLKSFQSLGLAKVSMPYVSEFSALNTWKHKPELNKKFKKYVYEYRRKVLKAQAYLNNLMWATMFQAKFPDKRFREIYFAYQYATVGDVQLIHPYSTIETSERTTKMTKRRMICLPKGVYQDSE